MKNVEAKFLLHHLFYTLRLTIAIPFFALFPGQPAYSQYTLQDEDVRVVSGVLISCTYQLEIKEIIIPDTLDGQAVTAIDDGDWDYEAGIFSHRALTSVVLPSTLEKIGAFAFLGNNLKVVDFTRCSALYSLGYKSFNSNEIESINFSACTSLAAIEDLAFAGNQLTSLILPEQIETIGKWAFFTNKLTYLDLSNCPNLLTLRSEVFQNNELITVEMPPHLEVIEENAFSSNKLKNLDLSVCRELISIRSNAFQANDSLAGFNLPANLEYTDLGWRDYRGKSYAGGDRVSDLETGYYIPAAYTLTDRDAEVQGGVIRSCSYTSNLTVVKIPDILDGQSITGIDYLSYNNSFRSRGCVQIVFPSTLKRIENRALRDGYLLELDFSKCSSLTFIGEYAFTGNQLRTAILPESIEIIETRAFSSNMLTDIDLSSCTNLRFIKRGAFSSNSLSSFLLPPRIEFIDEGAFYSNKLDSVDLRNYAALRMLGSNAFGGNEALDGIYLPVNESYNHFGWMDGLNNSYVGGDWVSDLETSYHIPAPYTLKDSDVEIRDGIILSCSFDFRIKDIVIPDILDGQSVKGIGDRTSNGFKLFKAEGITHISLPATLEIINSFSFSSNELKSIDLSKCIALSYIGESAFAGNDSTLSFNLPIHKSYAALNWKDNKGNSIMGSEAVSDLESDYYIPASYTLNDSDVWVQEGIIRSCSYNFSLKSIVIPDTLGGQLVTGIGSKSEYVLGIFGNASLVSVVLPSALEQIGDHAFCNNKLPAVIVPDSLNSIGLRAFDGNFLSGIKFPGTMESIGEWAFYSNQLTELDLGACTALQNIGANSFRSNKLSKVIFPPNLQCIGDGAFATNMLTGVDFSSSGALSTIGAAAFGRNEISSLNLRSCTALQSIGREAFSENKLSSLNLNPCKALISIGKNAFRDNEISSLDVDSVLALVSIGEDAFSGNKLTNLDLSANLALELIDHRAFTNNKLTNVLLPSGLVHLRDQVFQDNLLSVVDLSGCISLTSIGDQAFLSNTLLEVDVSNCTSLAYIGKEAFGGNDSVHNLVLPIHAKMDVFGWKDSQGTAFSGGDTVSNMLPAYYIPVPYTLRDADVEMVDGLIQFCSYDYKIKDIIIPDSLDGQAVTGIAEKFWISGVFYRKGIRSIQFPPALKTIGGYAFSGNELSTVVLPDSLESIGDYAFENSNISNLDFSACRSLISIGKNAFFGNGLAVLDLEYCSALTSIGDLAFRGNELSEIILPASLEIIGDWAFSDHTLSHIDLSGNSGLAYIGIHAFDNNSTFQLSMVLPVNLSYTEYGWIDGDGFSYQGGDEVHNLETRYYVPAPYTLTDEDVVVTGGVIESCSYHFAFKDIRIPEMLDGQVVTGIADGDPEFGLRGVFSSKGIYKLNLPSTLESIGSHSFAYNKLMRLDLTSCTALNYIGNLAFNGNNTVLSLPIPEVDGYYFEHWIDSENKIYQGGEQICEWGREYRAVLHPAFAVHFTVRDTQGPVDGALVILSGYESLSTDSTGLAILKGILPGTAISYLVSAPGYDTISGLLTVSYADFSQKIELNMLTYSVSFTVTSVEGDWIEGATVTLSGYGMGMTDNSGHAAFTEIRPEEEMAYLVTAAGFSDYSGFISVAAADVQVDVVLNPVTGWDEAERDELRIYPNPAKESFYVQLNVAATVILSDMRGREVYLQELQRGLTVIPVNHLEPGHYLLKIKSMDFLVVGKVIIH
jgi:hypothetical protein